MSLNIIFYAVSYVLLNYYVRIGCTVYTVHSIDFEYFDMEFKGFSAFEYTS